MLISLNFIFLEIVYTRFHLDKTPPLFLYNFFVMSSKNSIGSSFIQNEIIIESNLRLFTVEVS
jgi:hypothetical protein